MNEFSFSMLSGLTIRGAKAGLYKVVSKFLLSTANPAFGGVYRFESSCAVKLFLDEECENFKWLSISESMLSAGSFVCELSVATRAADGVYNGSSWSVKAGEHQIKVVG